MFMLLFFLFIVSVKRPILQFAGKNGSLIVDGDAMKKNMCQIVDAQNLHTFNCKLCALNELCCIESGQ